MPHGWRLSGARAASSSSSSRTAAATRPARSRGREPVALGRAALRWFTRTTRTSCAARTPGSPPRAAARDGLAGRHVPHAPLVRAELMRTFRCNEDIGMMSLSRGLNLSARRAHRQLGRPGRLAPLHSTIGPSPGTGFACRKSTSSSGRGSSVGLLERVGRSTRRSCRPSGTRPISPTASARPDGRWRRAATNGSAATTTLAAPRSAS